MWALGAALLLGALTLGALRPQAAFPETSTLVGALIVAAAGLTAWRVAPLRALSRVHWIAAVGAATWACVWVVGLIAMAPVPALGRPMVVIVLQGALVFATACWLARSDGARACSMIAWWIVGLAVAMGLHGIYQVHGTAAMPGTFKASEAALLAGASGYDADMLEGILHALREGRASSWWGSPNIFAGIVAAALPLAAGHALRRDRAGWLAMAAFAVCLWALLLTGSRGGLLAAMVGLGVFGLLLGVSLRRAGGSPSVVAALVAALLLVGVSAGAMAKTVRDGGRWLGTSTIDQRLMYWNSAWDIWRENILVGAGPGAFIVHYAQHRAPAANETLYAHSWLFDWGSQVGAVGLAAFVVWCVSCVALGGRMRPTHLRAAWIGCAATLLVHGLVEFTLNTAEMYLLLALVLGVLAGSGDDGATPPQTSIRARAMPLAPVAMCATLLLWWQVPASSGESLRDMIPYATADQIGPLIDDAIAAEPDHPTAWESKGLLLLDRGDLAGAEAVLLQARRLNPWSARLCESLGRVRVEQGRLDDALALQREAIERHPADLEHRLRLVELLIGGGDQAAAVAAYQEAIEKSRSRSQREAAWRDALGQRLNLP